jgi:hypothetical protein
MKRRPIVIAATAGLALAAWIAWLIAHSTPSNPAVQAIPTPTATPVFAVTEVTSARASSPGPSATAKPAPPIVVASARPRPSAAVGASPAAKPAAAAPHKLDRATAMIELQKVRAMVASYHTLMGQNPVGTNAEIMKALMGGNPRQAMLGPPPGQSLDAKGELLDPWGTPYFFHQMSADDMEIHSAGPDRIMWTSDDLVIH